MSAVNVEETVTKYEAFINDVLKEDLRQVTLRLQSVNAEISDLIQQKHTLKVLTNKEIHPDGFKTQVNLGCNFFMEAAIKDTSKILFHVGLNHFVEFTIAEANNYLDARIKAYEKKADELSNNSADIKAHIKLMLFGMDELQNKGTASKS